MLIAAQIAIQFDRVLPFSSLYFGRFSVAGIFVNLIGIPRIGVFVPIALLTGLLHLIPCVGPVLAWLPACGAVTRGVAAVKDLTPAERLQLAAELWGSVAESQDEIPITDEVKCLLDARFAHYQMHPETATTWDELKRRLGKVD